MAKRSKQTATPTEAIASTHWIGIDSALGADAYLVRDTKDVVNAVIQFANGDISPPWFDRMTGPGGMKIVTWDDGDSPDPRQVVTLQIEAERRYAIEALDFAAKGVVPLLKWLRKQPEESLLSTRKRLFLKDRLAFSYLVNAPRDNRVWTRFAAETLASEPHGQQTDVGLCRLPTCRRFFLIDWNEGNRPRTKYCRPGHRVEFHELTAAERQRRSRISKAREPK
jgi:hypothetical protein